MGTGAEPVDGFDLVLGRETAMANVGLIDEVLGLRRVQCSDESYSITNMTFHC